MNKGSQQAKGSLWGGYHRPGKPAAVHDCYFQCASNDSMVEQLWAYMDELSYSQCGVAHVHVNTTAVLFDACIYKDGAIKQIVFEHKQMPGHFQTTPLDCSISGCNWPLSFKVDIGERWSSGGYVLELTAKAADGSKLQYHHIFLVRPGNGPKINRLLLVAATGTWTAYNDWGGSNHYEGIAGETADKYSPILSLDRPYARGFVKLPEDAPRIPLKMPLKMGAQIRYPHMQWAYDEGFSKKYASAGWASYERHYVHWLEKEGYNVDIISEQDLHYRPELVNGYDCVTIIGHSEYWSWEMRDTIDSYVDGGGNIARFAGNFFWQIRFEDEGRTQVCYKYEAREQDPLYNTEQSHLSTICWDAAEVGRPGAQTFGLTGTSGIYAGWGGCSPRGAGGFTIYRPEHWAFEGCDLYYGDILGAHSRVFGYEVDGVDYVVENGVPHATGTDGAPTSLQIIAMGLASAYEADHHNGLPLFIGSDDAEFLARTLHDMATPETLERYKHGCGMIAIFERGQGCVFNAGTCEWIAGLIDYDPQIEQVTRNVFSRFMSNNPKSSVDRYSS